MWLCMCGAQNDDSTDICLFCNTLRSVGEKSKEKEQERKQKEQERKQKEQENIDAFLKENGHEGYYEYKVVSLSDNYSGSLDTNNLCERLNSLGRNGWRLKCAYANELGHESSKSGYATSTNATIDQNILIFERFIKF